MRAWVGRVAPRAEAPSPWQRGEAACAQCGLVVDSVADAGPERRAYDASQLARIRAAPLRLVSKTEMGVKAKHGPRWLALAGFYRDTLHGKERRLAAIGAEVSRVRECAGAPHRVAEAALALVRRHVYDLEGLSAGAVAALWLASKDLGEPRPLRDFLKCSKADRSAVKRAAWRLNEAARGRRPPLRSTSRWWRLGPDCRLPW